MFRDWSLSKQRRKEKEEESVKRMGKDRLGGCKENCGEEWSCPYRVYLYESYSERYRKRWGEGECRKIAF